ncbi:methyltransferase-like protein 6 [Phalaenopsis equestris]|uniref:methyltransferase-like protein 6 n=1 Tax=Phalaenopsis equestris TaxID=78828 RepID=UPI0009E54E43|nr:methyltransferase-like protein 6 [Phalaenopsis equestris]XP_020591213.1 methyltransferase-like protein 6 [Phalaenopsis equestris]
MAEEGKVVRYFSRDFEWEELRDEVERNPKFGYHLFPFSLSLSSSSQVAADAEAWRSFHRRHSTGLFFKERRYLLKEFPELTALNDSIHVLEVGCGNGSTSLPILRAKQNVIVYACDCSQDALDKAGEMVASSNFPSIKRQFYPFLLDFSVNRFPDWLLCTACQKSSLEKQSLFTPDASGKAFIRLNGPSFLEAKCCIGGMDYVTLIFTLSAITFQRMSFVIAECMAVLKPGGLLLFRDYGLYDMTMLRFPPEQRVGFREYMRSDGTLSYFFSLDIVRKLFLGAGFIELELEYCCVLSVNHRSGKKMKRVWVHGKFQKPIVGSS